jgi:hypothetical protein
MTSRVGDVFNMKRSPYTQFLSCIHWYLVGRSMCFLQSNKNPPHLVLIGRDFHPLVMSDNLNGRGADWIHLLQA